VSDLLLDRVTTVYQAHFTLLRFVARDRFGVPHADAENLVQEVFVAYLRHYPTIENDKAWLLTATTNACRGYWRRNERRRELFEPEELTAANPESRTASGVDAKALFARIPNSCREILRLRFYDGLSGAEIARELQITVGYAKLKLHRCLQTARALLGGSRG
jgi:RNA polymerase sigma-70 factor (ECF subfamily)